MRIALPQKSRYPMTNRWSPHPRYRLYTSAASYAAAARQLAPRGRDAGESCARLEAEVCRRFDVAAAVCVPMARTGLYLVLQELIRPGQTVVMSPLTIVDVVNMVLLSGGIPVFADIRRDSCGVNPEIVEDLIDHRTGAVLITHLHGETADALVFRDICRRRRVPLIEDAAQAFGAVENGRRLGTIGDLGVYSFGFYKNVNAWRGGMVVAQDPDLIAGIRRRMKHLPALPCRRLLAIALSGLLTDLATWPPLFGTVTHSLIRLSVRRRIEAVNRRLDPESGARRLEVMPAEYLFRMTTSQATLAMVQLDLVDTHTRARIHNAAMYDHGLAGIECLIRPEWRGDGSNIYTCYPIRCRGRDNLLRHALLQRRDFAAQHLRNCADLPEFKELRRDCPNARGAALELVLLPTYPRYPAGEIARNIDMIQSFFGPAFPLSSSRSSRPRSGS
jgi:dTDP-4-amino-4,6-dideoxygalactose transaminase